GQNRCVTSKKPGDILRASNAPARILEAIVHTDARDIEICPVEIRRDRGGQQTPSHYDRACDNGRLAQADIEIFSFDGPPLPDRIFNSATHGPASGIVVGRSSPTCRACEAGYPEGRNSGAEG